MPSRRPGRSAKRTGLKYPLDHYARVFGSSERTVKRWRQLGEEKGELPPLDDPEAMLAWWSRNMSQRAPRGLNQAVVEYRKVNGLAAGTERERAGGQEGELPLDAPAREEDSPIPAAPREVIVPEGRGLDAELARLQEFTAWASANARNPGGGKIYMDALARMTVVEQKLREEAERQGKLLPKEAVESAIREFFVPIEREFRGMYRGMSTQVDEQAATDAARWHKLLCFGIAEDFEALQLAFQTKGYWLRNLWRADYSDQGGGERGRIYEQRWRFMIQTALP